MDDRDGLDRLIDALDMCPGDEMIGLFLANKVSENRRAAIVQHCQRCMECRARIGEDEIEAELDRTVPREAVERLKRRVAQLRPPE